jgi:DNA repair protein SbcC/Rad50
MNIQSARERLGHKLADVSEVATGVLRGVRRNGKRDVAAYVFDLNNRVPETIGNLSDYLDEVMGPAYFNRDASPDLRWNSYLYFVVDGGRANHQISKFSNGISRPTRAMHASLLWPKRTSTAC